AITCSLARERRAPARSTTAPQTTLPMAPHSTTSAALTAAWSAAMPCTRLRKLGNHDHTADTTMSCAAPPMHTHSIVRDRTMACTEPTEADAKNPAINAPRMREGKWLAISAEPTEP